MNPCRPLGARRPVVERPLNAHGPTHPSILPAGGCGAGGFGPELDRRGKAGRQRGLPAGEGRVEAKTNTHEALGSNRPRQGRIWFMIMTQSTVRAPAGPRRDAVRIKGLSIADRRAAAMAAAAAHGPRNRTAAERTAPGPSRAPGAGIPHAVPPSAPRHGRCGASPGGRRAAL